MAQSLPNILLHIIFSTKGREPYLSTPDLRQAMNAYMVGTLRNIGCPSLIVNCVEDHLHCLCRLSRTITVAKLIEEMKTASSAWIKTQPGGPRDFHWQGGYGAFSVSPSNVSRVRSYIANQEEHHRRMSFQDEFREFLPDMAWNGTNATSGIDPVLPRGGSNSRMPAATQGCALGYRMAALRAAASNSESSVR